MYYKYYVNLDERGDFNADVRAPDGTSVFEICDAEHLWELVDGGFMQNKEDLDGLMDYLCGIGILGSDDDDRLVSGN
jgi:hypothetical protein